jgi:membrane associated rhomboid family serine protease
MALFPVSDDNPLRTVSFQYVTVTLIALNVAVFLWEISLGSALDRAIFAYGAIPAVLFGEARLPPGVAEVPSWATLFTSMFLHGGWMHLLGNMLFLWIFGDNVEDSMGHVRYLLFYLLCGLIAALVHALSDPGSEIPVVGASGAISGVLGAYLILHPRARLLVLAMSVIPLRLPAFIVLGLWIVLQFAGLGGASDIAFLAHIGGFIAGAALIVPFRRRGLPLFDGMVGSVPIEPERVDRDERRHARSIFPNTVARRGPWER